MRVAVVVQLLNHVQHFATPSTAAYQASLSFTISWNFLKFMSIESVMPFNHHNLCCPLLLLPSAFPSIRVFSESQLFASGGQSIYNSASTSALLMNTQDWSRSGWTGWISLQSKGLSRVFSNTTAQKHQFFGTQFFFIVQLSHPYMTSGKTIALTRRTFVGKVMPLLFNTLSRFVISFLARSKPLLISWMQAPSAVIWSPRK